MLTLDQIKTEVEGLKKLGVRKRDIAEKAGITPEYLSMMISKKKGKVKRPSGITLDNMEKAIAFYKSPPAADQAAQSAPAA